MKKKAAPSEGAPANAAGFEHFQAELTRLVARFEKDFKLYQSSSYSEASVRQDFLDPLFAALGWDIGNKLGLIPQHREVEIESRTEISGRQKRADYLFRTDRTDRFVCEAKKPAEELHAGHAFQAKRYAWNKNLVLAVLSDFEEIKIYLVGARPHADDPDTGHFQTWHYLEYVQHALEIWNLLSRDAVAAGSIEKLVADLPRKPAGKTRQKQMWLFKPDRARAIDADFLDFLDEARRELASDLIRHNDRADLLEGTRLDEAVQRILDRLLFLRICEDRDIDTGRPLANILKSWRGRADNPPHRKLRAPALPLHEAAAEYAAATKPAPPGSLWREIVDHFRALDRRPASHIPYFNGNLFKEHFSETLNVSDEWISGFLDEIGDDESPYLFNVIPVEILGTIYERFLGKTVRPHGRGVTIEEKPEVRKAGGVYYTPRYIVDYIVEQTLGKLIDGKAPAETLKLRVLDPACGSGSFLIRAFERLCEHWQTALIQNDKLRRKTDCWTDPATGDLHLTTDLKRRILTANVYGVDLDPGAVEVTQLSLYLKMLEGESRATLAQNRELFSPDAPLLPPLQDNIKCGNSLIASDFSLNPDDLVRVRAFDWNEGFRDIMQNGGFDVVVGNPPWGAQFSEAELEYLRQHHRDIIVRMIDSFMYFVHAGIRQLKSGGAFGMILPDVMLYQTDTQILRQFLTNNTSLTCICNMGDVFDQVTRPACIISCIKLPSFSHKIAVADLSPIKKEEKPVSIKTNSIFAEIDQDSIMQIPGYLFATSNLSNYTLWSRVTACPSQRLGDIVDEDGIQRGVSPDLKEAFLVDRRTARENMLETDKLRPVLTGGKQVKRYYIDRPDLMLIYTKRDDDYRKSPEICKYIDQFKKQITCKEVKQGKHSLYSLHRAREEHIFLKPHKLIGVITEDEIVLALDSCKTFATDGLYLFGLKPSIDIRYVMGILNSQLFISIYRLLSLEEGRTLAQVKPTILANLPIRTIDLSSPSSRASHDKLVALVDKMLVLVPRLRSAKSETERATLQNAVNATDRAIDALVYELYGLTPEEVAVVEGTSKS